MTPFESIRLKTGLHLKGIYENEVKDRPSETKVTYRTFLEWHATGSKFIAIACGGSIYALVLISGLGLRVSITSMVGTTHLHLADMLQSPPKGKRTFCLGWSDYYPCMCRFPSKEADSWTHCTHHHTHASLLSLQYDLNVLSCFNREILHLKGYRLHRLLSIRSFFWCYHSKVHMRYSYVIYRLT